MHRMLSAAYAFHTEREIKLFTYHSRSRRIIEYLSNSRPTAAAQICGNTDYPSICGTLMLYQTHAGVFIVVSVGGIPEKISKNSVLGMHIHDPETGMHYNPGNKPHPYHAGDMPPLFVNGTDTWCAFLSERFQVNDVIGKTAVIHAQRDDFTTQPSGDSGEKIAQGTIKRYNGC